MSRYEAQELDGDDAAPVLRRAYTSAAYLDARVQNLRLLERHGANAWLLGNYQLEGELRRVEAQLAHARREIDEVNAARQRRQADVKGELVGAEEAWRAGVGKVLEAEVAVEEMRALVRDELRKRVDG
jgi:pre-mRNA-splicing factor SPF27